MFIKKSLLIFLLKIGLMSECFANEYQLITYENISSEVSFKKWGENGLGNVVDKHILTLVKAKTKKSNITVFRWNKKGSNFVSELYEFEDSDNYSTTWRMKNNNNVLTLQHNSFYMIQFKIPGEQGGVMSEIFKLPDENK
jgi:hypothetical protein